jgi:radical SAM superfamily enzyme YgiQ (UPF0313 family)
MARQHLHAPPPERAAFYPGEAMGTEGSIRAVKKLTVALVGMQAESGGDTVVHRGNALGIALLKSFCDARPELSGAPRIVLFDESAAVPPETLADRIIAVRPDVAGFSLRECNYRICAQTALLLRRARPGIKIIIGGYEAWARTGLMLRLCGADCAVIGEGETPFAQLMLAWTRGQSGYGILGTARLRGGIVDYAPSRGPLDLGQSVSPYLDGTYDAREYRRNWITLETSRGCPNSCSWCSWPNSCEIRYFPMEKVKREIAFACSLPEQCAVSFADSNIFSSPQRAVEILQAIRRFDPEQKRRWGFNPYPGHITPEIAKLCNHRHMEVACGIETRTPRALKLNLRPYNFRAEEYGARLLLEHAPLAHVPAQLICGLPGDTLADFLNSVDEAYRIGFKKVDVFPLNVLPGTRLYRHAEESGVKFMPESPFLALETPDFPARDILRAHYIVSVMETLRRDPRCREPLLEHARAGGSASSAALELEARLRRAGLDIGRPLQNMRPQNAISPLTHGMTRHCAIPENLGGIIAGWAHELRENRPPTALPGRKPVPRGTAKTCAPAEAAK